MYDHDAVDIFYFQRYSFRYDRLCPYEHDLRQIQEIVTSNVHTCCPVHLEIYVHISLFSCQHIDMGIRIVNVRGEGYKLLIDG